MCTESSFCYDRSDLRHVARACLQKHVKYFNFCEKKMQICFHNIRGHFVEVGCTFTCLRFHLVVNPFILSCHDFDMDGIVGVTTISASKQWRADVATILWGNVCDQISGNA